MSKFEELPRGQLSTIILMCLSDKDKYGYEIIDEVLNKTNGKMSIKQPSLYSSLKRMEEQKLISSYWRDSEIGGKRHYYHLTDLGKKHLEKWQANITLNDSKSNIKSNEDNGQKVLHQENLFNISKKEVVIDDSKDNASATYVSEGQIDLFSNLNNLSTKEDRDYMGLPSAKNAPEQTPILTHYEKPEEIDHIKKFEYIKKNNKSFADTVKSIKFVEDKKYTEKTNNTTIHSSTLNNTNNNSSLVTALSLEKSEIIGEDKSSFDSNLTEENLNDPELNSQQESINKININSLDGYNGNAKNTSVSHSENCIRVTTSISPHAQCEEQSINTPQQKKDDGVLITERIDFKDIPKQPKFEARKFEIYISDNSLTPKFKSNKNEAYEDRIKDLYEKSKHNAENQELELIDSKIKFSNYSELQAFYNEQNIKFKPYQKTLYRSNKDFDMIKINKLRMITSLMLLLAFSVLSIISGIIFSTLPNALGNHPLTFSSIPMVMLLVFFICLFTYEKSPQKRVAFDVNKFKFNWLLFSLSILLIPIILAINLLIGFNFTEFEKYSVTFIYPCLLSLVYLVYYLIQKTLSKSKSFY